jgi:hypothetical protein
LELDLKVLDLFSTENLKRVFVVLVVVAFGVSMAARKQFNTNFSEIFYPYEYSVVEGHEKELGHLHPFFHKDAYAPPALLMVPYSLHYSKGFHVFSPILHWVVVIGLMALIIRQAGFDHYASIVLTMLVLFVGALAAREIFDIPILGPAPPYGYQSFDYRTFLTPLTLASIMLVFRGRLVLSSIVVGLITIMHIKYGLRIFGLLMGCIALWNLLGCRWVKESQLIIPWRSVAGFCFCWVIIFVPWYLYVHDTLQLFAELDVPRVGTPFLSQLGWLIKNEPDDFLISYHFSPFTVSFFGFLFLATTTIVLCELIRRRTPKIELKIMAAILILSVLVSLMFFSYGFLFEIFLIDHLPLSWSTNLMLARAWDLIWLVPMAFTIAVFSYSLLWAESLDRKFKKYPFAIRKLFLHVVLVGFVTLNLYIFIEMKDGSAFKNTVEANRSVSLPYTQICTEDTALYKQTVDTLWKFSERSGQIEFFEQLQILETIFDRTLKPTTNEETNNPDVKNLRVIHDLKSNRYRLSILKLITEDPYRYRKSGIPSYLWSCDEKGPGIHHEHVEISFQDFYDVSQWLSKNTPVNHGVISPPYIYRMGLYSRRVNFYDNKLDGVLMTMIEGFYPIGAHRIQTLAGPYGVEMAPGIRHGIVGLRGRAYFLSLKRKDFLQIKKSYPYYEYLVTENQALSGFPKLYSNASLAIYDISE